MGVDFTGAENLKSVFDFSMVVAVVFGLNCFWGCTGSGSTSKPPSSTPSDDVRSPAEVIEPIDVTQFSVDELMTPSACKECHADHYREWSGSMHAYASTSPIYRAMNQRGQREVPGGLGTKCVACHAPMAVRLGLTTDGLNMDELPEYAQGVTCFFCHSIESLEKVHVGSPVLATDGAFRGPIADPVNAGAHKSVYSTLHTQDSLDSARLCGSCHGASWLEWETSFFSNEEFEGSTQTCGHCHMRGRNGPAASTPGAPERRIHNHMWAGVDVALTPFPEAQAQRLAVMHELDTSVAARLCVREEEGQPVATVRLGTSAVGHNWPSCEARDRRAWVELMVYNAAGKVVFSSGNVADGQPLMSLDDPYLWFMFERLTDADGLPMLMPWDAVGYENSTLSPPTFAPWDPEYVDSHVVQEYPLPEMPDRVEMRVRIRPIGLDVIDDLIATGDLDPIYRDKMPTFSLKFTQLEWRAALSKECVDP